VLGYQGLCPVAREDYSLQLSERQREDPSGPEEIAWRRILDFAAEARSVDREQAAAATFDPSNAFGSLYWPLCQPVGTGSRVIAHLGQSIDGYIATASGDSNFVNDPENLRHLHRLRALSDAIIVGAGTIAADDPELTTRRVAGPDPVRVVLDPKRRLPATSRVFTDTAAATILVVADSVGGSPHHGKADVLGVPVSGGEFDLASLVAALADRGLKRLFVEGGGTTVSRFFDANQLDRLHIAIAPVLTGRGRPGLRLASHHAMADCPRPNHRVFTMGQDILIDCDLRASSGNAEAVSRDHETYAIRQIR
jgi:riboflavin-specific deaminase-like protein